MSEPGGPLDDGPATFCNLPETCGDGVCDERCEDAEFCAEDCQPEGTTEQPQGAAATCGDGACDPDEQGCGVCSADCSPC